MPEYRHGIYVQEASTDLITLTRQASGVTFVVGTAPIREASSPAGVNEPVRCSTYNEAVAAFGYSTDTGTYTLCEAMEVLFGLYNVAPIVMVNVFDPSAHKTTYTREEHLVTLDHKVELDGDILSTGIKVETMTEEEDDEVWTEITPTATTYALEKTTLTLADSFAMGAKVYVTYSKPDVSKVTATDIAGSVDATTGKATGLELVNEIYARFGYTVGRIIAPGFSEQGAVGLKMAAKAENIDGHFSAIAIADLPTGSIGGYAQAASVKNTLGYSHSHLITCYPCVKVGNKVQRLSTHVAGVMSKLAAENGDVPYWSPSNQPALINGMCNADGTSNYFGGSAANALNGNGILTVTNFNGWKFWGNRLSLYPSSEDPKDTWINVRSMFNFVKAALVTRFRSMLDVPIHRRQIDSIINSANTYLNGLTSMGALLGGRVEFNNEDNTEAAIMSGKLVFRLYLTPPSPAEDIEFIMQYDASYLSGVLEG